MHGLVGIRGNYWDALKFISEIQAKYSLMDFEEEQKQEDGTMKKVIVKYPVNVIFRPYIIGELIFPETALQTVIATIKDKTEHKDNFIFNQIRKRIGFEKFPEYDGKTPPWPVWDKNIEIVPIGIKKDEFRNGHEFL